MKDAMPNRGLPPIEEIEQQVGITLGAALPNNPAYSCILEWAKELPQQINKLLEIGIVRPYLKYSKQIDLRINHCQLGEDDAPPSCDKDNSKKIGPKIRPNYAFMGKEVTNNSLEDSA